MTAPDHRPAATSGPRLTLRERAAIERTRGRRLRTAPTDEESTGQLGLLPGSDADEAADGGEDRG